MVCPFSPIHRSSYLVIEPNPCIRPPMRSFCQHGTTLSWIMQNYVSLSQQVGTPNQNVCGAIAIMKKLKIFVNLPVARVPNPPLAIFFKKNDLFMKEDYLTESCHLTLASGCRYKRTPLTVQMSLTLKRSPMSLSMLLNVEMTRSSLKTVSDSEISRPSRLLSAIRQRARHGNNR